LPLSIFIRPSYSSSTGNVHYKHDILQCFLPLSIFIRPTYSSSNGNVHYKHDILQYFSPLSIFIRPTYSSSTANVHYKHDILQYFSPLSIFIRPTYSSSTGNVHYKHDILQYFSPLSIFIRPTYSSSTGNVHTISTVLCCVVLWYCFVCLRVVSCTSGIVGVCGLSVLACTFGFFWRLFQRESFYLYANICQHRSNTLKLKVSSPLNISVSQVTKNCSTLNFIQIFFKQ
jgi:hypothetical protein